MEKIKIAVLIAGPPRYVNSLTDSIKNNIKISDGFELDFFYFIYKKDLSSKRRKFEEKNHNKIINSNNTRMFIFERPFDETFVKKYASNLNESGHSLINATFGMFYSLFQLVGCFNLLIDKKDYTHILKLRTDTLIIKKNFLKGINFKSDCLYTAQNPHITKKQISDHIFFAKTDIFLSLFLIKNINQFIKEYKRNSLPENYLFNLLKKKKILFNPFFKRYTEYYIIANPTNPVMEGDPKFIHKYLNSKKMIRKLFLNPLKYLDLYKLQRLRNKIIKNKIKFNIKKILKFF